MSTDKLTHPQFSLQAKMCEKIHKLVSFARNPVILLEKSEIGEPKASGIFSPQSGRKIVGRGKSALALAAPAGT